MIKPEFQNFRVEILKFDIDFISFELWALTFDILITFLRRL